MIVLKFGGSSVRDAEWIGNTLKIAADRLAESPVLVSSAMGDTTDALVLMADRATAGDTSGTQELLDQLSRDHRETLEEITHGCPVESCRDDRERLETLLSELSTLVQGITLVRELSPRVRDALLAFGERLSTTIIAAGATARSIPNTLLDSRTLIRTSPDFGSARPDFDTTGTQIRRVINPRAGHLFIAQGFIGATADGVTTTLGRGGSDFSATIIGSALQAERVEIWTDVDGIMTADPRIVPDARTTPEVSYNEAAELAFFGARVIHPSTLIPAVELEIPVVVCNTRNPDGPKTYIRRAPSQTGLRAVAGRNGVTIITVYSSRMLNAWGFLSRMFRVFETHRVIVDLIATSEISVSVSIDVPDPPQELLTALQVLGQVQVDRNKAVLSLVGEKMWKSPELIRDVFDAIAATLNHSSSVEMVSLGSSETNLSVVVDQDHLEPAMREIHRRFFHFPKNNT